MHLSFDYDDTVDIQPMHGQARHAISLDAKNGQAQNSHMSPDEKQFSVTRVALRKQIPGGNYGHIPTWQRGHRS